MIFIWECFSNLLVLSLALLMCYWTNLLPASAECFLHVCFYFQLNRRKLYNCFSSFCLETHALHVNVNATNVNIVSLCFVRLGAFDPIRFANSMRKGHSGLI